MEILSLTLGVLYNILSLTYRLPQMFKIIRTKKVRDISVKMMNIQSASYVVSITYGTIENDWVWIVSSSIALLQNIIIYILRWRYLTRIISNSSGFFCDNSAQTDLTFDNIVLHVETNVQNRGSVD